MFDTGNISSELQCGAVGEGVYPLPLAATAPPLTALPRPPGGGGFLAFLSASSLFFPDSVEADRVRVGAADPGSARGSARQ